MFFNVVFTLHIILCVVLIGLVLVQQGKGADLGAAMGGGANTVFGAGGATNFIVRLTTGVAVAFMITSIIMVKSYSSMRNSAVTGVATQGDLLEGSAVSKLGEQAKAQEASGAQGGQGASAVASSASAAASSAPAVAPESPAAQPASPEQPKTAPEAAESASSAPVAPPPPPAAAPEVQPAAPAAQ